MNDKEYTYDIDKYTIGVDENGEDGIGLTVAKVENGEIHFLGNCYGENARCIDLLIKENKELKLQLKCTTHCFDEEEHEKLKKEVEEYKDKINWYENFEVNKTIDKLRLKYNTQQKEFIEYMNKTIEELECDDVDDEEMKGYLIQRIDTFKEILSKYKEIIVG